MATLFITSNSDYLTDEDYHPGPIYRVSAIDEYGSIEWEEDTDDFDDAMSLFRVAVDQCGCYCQVTLYDTMECCNKILHRNPLDES